MTAGKPKSHWRQLGCQEFKRLAPEGQVITQLKEAVMRKRLGSGKTQGPDGRWVAGTPIPEDNLMAEDLAVIATPPKKWRRAKEAGFHYKHFSLQFFLLSKSDFFKALQKLWVIHRCLGQCNQAC